MSLINLTPAQLRQAADLKERIAGLNNELTAIFGGGVTSLPIKAAVPVAKKKSGMSAAGKARIVAAQKLRWAKVHAAKAKPAAKAVVAAKPGAKAVPIAKAPQAVKPAAKPVRVISAAARARMATAAKAMWVRIRAAKAAKKK